MKKLTTFLLFFLPFLGMSQSHYLNTVGETAYFLEGSDTVIAFSAEDIKFKYKKNSGKLFIKIRGEAGGWIFRGLADSISVNGFTGSSAVKSIGAAKTIPDWDFLANTGQVEGVTAEYKFGFNADIDDGTVPEDIWRGGGIYTGQPVGGSAETVDVVSTDADDTAAGSGARTVAITGLDANWDLQNDTLTMNGTTAVTTTTTWFRVFRLKVLTSGASDENEGTITVNHTTTTANVFINVAPNVGQSQVAAYTVPRGFTAYITSIDANISRGGTNSADFYLRTRKPGESFQTLANFSSGTTYQTTIDLRSWYRLEEMTDVKLQVWDVTNNNTEAGGDFQFYLVKN